MLLRQLPLPPDAAPLPAGVVAVLADGKAQLAAHSARFSTVGHARGLQDHSESVAVEESCAGGWEMWLVRPG
jgi:hypothetical protein